MPTIAEAEQALRRSGWKVELREAHIANGVGYVLSGTPAELRQLQYSFKHRGITSVLDGERLLVQDPDSVAKFERDVKLPPSGPRPGTAPTEAPPYLRGLYEHMQHGGNPPPGPSLIPPGYEQQYYIGFQGLKRNNFDFDTYYQSGDGWKLHLSIHPQDLERAWDRVIAPIITNSQVGAAKFAHGDVLTRFADPNSSQAGKIVTLYGEGNKSWAEIAREIEIGLAREGIRPGPAQIPGDRMVPGSRYIGYRNERAHGPLAEYGKNGYLSSSRIRDLVAEGKVPAGWEHNPAQEPDSLQRIDFSRDREVLAARGEVRPPAAEVRQPPRPEPQAETPQQPVVPQYEQEPGTLKAYQMQYGTTGPQGIKDLRIKTVDGQRMIAIQFNGEVSEAKIRETFGVTPSRAEAHNGQTWFEVRESELLMGVEQVARQQRAPVASGRGNIVTHSQAAAATSRIRENLGSSVLRVDQVNGGVSIETRSPFTIDVLREMGVDPSQIHIGPSDGGSARRITIPDSALPSHLTVPQGTPLRLTMDGVPLSPGLRLAVHGDVPPPHMLPPEPGRLTGGRIAGVAGMVVAAGIAGYELFHGRPAAAAVSLAGGLPVPGASTAMTAAVGGDIGESLQSDAKSLIGGILGGTAAGAAFGPPGAVAGGVVGGVMAAMPAPPEDQDRTAAHLNLLSPQGQVQFATMLNSLPAKPTPGMSPVLRELVMANAAMGRAVGKAGEEAASRELLRVYHNLIDDPKAMREAQMALGLDCPLPGLSADAAAQARAAGRQATAQLPATEGQVAANDKAPQGERIQFRQF